MNPLNQMTSQALRDQGEALAQAVVAWQYSLETQTWQKYGADGREKSVRDMGYHLVYLSVAIETETPVLFTEYISWVRVMFEGLKLPTGAVVNTLQATQTVVRRQMAPEMADLIDAYLAAALARLQEPPAQSPLFIDERLPLGGLARDYLEALLRGDRKSANRLILDARARGAQVQDLYLHVFQRVLYEVGRLWQTNQISVAQEHYSTYVTQLIMSQISPSFNRSGRVGRRMVATSVGGDMHEVGIRMVADFFEMAGWDTFFLGANTPSESVLRALVDRQADLLAISATITTNISQVTDLIARVRASEVGSRVKILVGGYPFNVSETLWQTVHADGYGRDAQQALEVANQLVGE